MSDKELLAYIQGILDSNKTLDENLVNLIKTKLNKINTTESTKTMQIPLISDLVKQSYSIPLYIEKDNLSDFSSHQFDTSKWSKLTNDKSIDSGYISSSNIVSFTPNQEPINHCVSAWSAK